MKKILIPSAKIVSQELQHIGKLPSVIYPLNQGVVLDRILECYRQADASFELILHEKANKVRHYVSSCGLGSNINLHVLDEVRDLGYSIYCGIRDAGFREGDTAVIHFGDTILYDVMPDHGDVCFYSEDIPTDTWTFFNEEEGRITEIWDKNLDGSSGTGLRKFFTGVFCLEHPATFLQMLSEAMEHGHPEDSFYTALAAYSVKYPLQMKKAEKWFDIGHADRYTGARMEVEARVFNHIVIDRERGILRKTSEEREKFIGEILWYLKLPSDIEYVRPRIFSYSTDYTSPYIEMEYYSYHTLHELYLYGELNEKQWMELFGRLRFLIDDLERYELRDNGIRDACLDMYLYKTMERLEKLREDIRFATWFREPICVNGIFYKPLDEICSLLPGTVTEKLCGIDRFNIIHGDLCFANILADPSRSFLKVIDPRGKFGQYDIYGDRRYEYAKLFHSIDGKYDMLIENRFELELDENRIRFQAEEGHQEFDLFQCFIECFADRIKNEREQIEFIEALLFLSMIPLHRESFHRQVAMLATGIQILDRVVDIKK